MRTLLSRSCAQRSLTTTALRFSAQPLAKIPLAKRSPSSSTRSIASTPSGDLSSSPTSFPKQSERGSASWLALVVAAGLGTWAFFTALEEFLDSLLCDLSTKDEDALVTTLVATEFALSVAPQKSATVLRANLIPHAVKCLSHDSATVRYWASRALIKIAKLNPGMKAAVLSELPLEPLFKTISELSSLEGGVREGDAHLALLGAHLLSDSSALEVAVSSGFVALLPTLFDSKVSAAHSASVRGALELSRSEVGRSHISEDFLRKLQSEVANPRVSDSLASPLGDEAFETSMLLKDALYRILSDPSFAAAHPNIPNKIGHRPFDRASHEQSKWIERQALLAGVAASVGGLWGLLRSSWDGYRSGSRVSSVRALRLGIQHALLVALLAPIFSVSQLVVDDYARREKVNGRVPLYYVGAAVSVAAAIATLRPLARFWVVPVTALIAVHGLEAARKSTPE